MKMDKRWASLLMIFVQLHSSHKQIWLLKWARIAAETLPPDTHFECCRVWIVAIIRRGPSDAKAKNARKKVWLLWFSLHCQSIFSVHVCWHKPFVKTSPRALSQMCCRMQPCQSVSCFHASALSKQISTHKQCVWPGVGFGHFKPSSNSNRRFFLSPSMHEIVMFFVRLVRCHHV